jgi:ribosomal protein S18 acetylase RimI-like enzyme
MRRFEGQTDFWRIRDFLIATYPITPPGFNWEIRRWEGWHTHREDPNSLNPSLKKIGMWETDDGKLIGVVNPEGEGDAHLQVHPDYRHLIEADMLIWAEENLAVPADGSEQRLDIYVNEYDAPRLRLVKERGYQQMPWWGVVRRLYFGKGIKPIPQPVITDGYTMRPIQADALDYQNMADLLNAAFNRHFHTAKEFDHFTKNAPSFRADLHLAAVAPDGSFASHVGVTYDESNRRGIFEPVCTHPAHRQKGLAQTLMFEGLHRLKALGARTAYVETGDMELANRLYDTIGFTEVYKGYIWRKCF